MKSSYFLALFVSFNLVSMDLKTHGSSSNPSIRKRTDNTAYQACSLSAEASQTRRGRPWELLDVEGDVADAPGTT